MPCSEALDEAGEQSYVSALGPLVAGLAAAAAHGGGAAAVFRDRHVDLVEEVDVALAAEDELVDDRRHELKIQVFAVENARVGCEHALRDVLDE